MTNFKILITDDGPVVIDAPVRPDPDWLKYEGDSKMWNDDWEEYNEALAFIIADKSKHLQFEDWRQAENTILTENARMRPYKIGELLDIPKGYQLEFKERCGLGKHDEPTCANIESCICVHDGIKVKLAALVPIKEKPYVDDMTILHDSFSEPSEPENSAQEDYEVLAKTLHGRIRSTDQEYIICAAIHFDDYLKHEHQPKNIKTGLVVCGRRHHNCFVTVSTLSQSGDYRDYKSKEKEQGFITSKDRFVNRKEAGEIAFKAGQTTELKTCLFSEDLY